MAKEQKQNAGVTGYQLNGNDGWAQIRAWEDERAISSEQRFNTTIISYEIQESPKGREITVTVNVGQRETARKAEFAGWLAVKARHPSVYSENKMAFQVNGEWHVMVRWMLWKPSDQTGGVSF